MFQVPSFEVSPPSLVSGVKLKFPRPDLRLRDLKRLLPHSHQSLNMFKICLVKHGLKLFFFFFRSCLLMFFLLIIKHSEKTSQRVLEPDLKLSPHSFLAAFHFVKPGLTKHVLLV